MGSLSPLLPASPRMLPHFFISVLYALFSSLFSLIPEHAKAHLLKSSRAQDFQSSSWEQVDYEIRNVLNHHGRYWWHTTGYVFNLLLQEAGYTEHAQRRILNFFGRSITPHLGVANEPGAKRWPSFMTDNHNPIELSWDWHTGKKAPSVRFSIEPVGPNAGTQVDPDNQSADALFRKVLMRALPNTNREWFDHFDQALAPDLPPKGCMEGHPSKIFYAFDLSEEDITGKAYFFPGFKARSKKQTNLQVLAQAIRTAPHCTDNEKLGAFRMFEDFAQDPSTPQLEMDMLAIDLVRPADSRLKIYFRTRETSFASVRQMMTMGNRITTSSLEAGLRNLRQLWDGVLAQTGVPDDTPLPAANHRTGGILYNMEFRPGSTAPNVKVYIPVRHYAPSDWHVVTALNEYMYGINRKSELPMRTYTETLRKVFTPEALQQRGLHTYIACSVQSGGELRVVSYLNVQSENFATA
ncbi:aromatic prenyltransferase [Aspergillus vadensis CBS 113365]|uniref:Aromatic prenyltransferase n=1 Tax=Aspergillus vadensis (strain CBS 113365 / IMI 142717 / IBT 24658) TaxID=1448311 RepID=A0A319BC73_ASPVC|nr:aromatic prenyltransferase [Aspergillus vadensis CBS 113365]PYH69534.1 aromatic prenyltransferase [Aspergillus vadensis CBS 113365]